MQTFLPYADYAHTARCLDRQRLGKQRVETLQILRTLLSLRRSEPDVAWANHPAVLQWEGYHRHLGAYGRIICSAWRNRGYADTCKEKITLVTQELILLEDVDFPTRGVPPWLGDDRLHSSHRAALLAKHPEHYGQFGWSEKPEINYYWPVKKRVN